MPYKCDEESRERARARYWANPQKYRDKAKQWRLANLERARANTARWKAARRAAREVRMLVPTDVYLQMQQTADNIKYREGTKKEFGYRPFFEDGARYVFYAWYRSLPNASWPYTVVYLRDPLKYIDEHCNEVEFDWLNNNGVNDAKPG